jgi:hypothetical protein
MIRYTEALAWRLRVLGVCRQAARQFVRKNPELSKDRFVRTVTVRIQNQAEVFAEFIRLTYKVDPERVQLAAQWFKDRAWKEIQQQRYHRR